MLKLTGIKVPLTADAAEMRRIVSTRLKIPLADAAGLRILKRAVDARDKSKICYVMNFGLCLIGEEALAVRLADPAVTVISDERPQFDDTPAPRRKHPPLVVGAGPCGLFAALYLAHRGLRPVLVERGERVETRRQDVERFWKGGALMPQSNVQFGEGGAGTFSDGKLTTGIKDPLCRLVLEEFVRCGAPEEIRYEAKPHIGTDKLAGVVAAIREEILRHGGTVRFRTRLTGLAVSGGAVTGALLATDSGEESFPTDTVILAAGHSARDTFELLAAAGAAMEAKSFSVGVRIEHRQETIGRSQYGAAYRSLPPADYKLSCRAKDGRGVYTFCMCPGGTVVNASSEEGGIAVNGMSAYARDGENANAAVLVSVGPEDYGGGGPLSGVAFQRKYERAAYALSGGYRPPAQRVADFFEGRASAGFSEVVPSVRPGAVPCDLAGCLPAFAVRDIREGLTAFDRKLRGYAAGGAVLTGVETRSSSPVRVLRGEDGMASIAGLFPAGEGAGYAGGIMSAAADGLRAAEKAAERP